jgi:hypothetical protein
MKLCAKIASERGKQEIKTGNEYIIIDLTVNRENVGQVELHMYPDEEWILKYQKNTHTDSIIVAQGHTDECVHDWDNYGKCCICGKWDTEGERTK